MKKIRTSAFVMITSPNGDVIMLKRRDAAKAGKSKIYVPGVYSLPGGVIEENEDPFAAVQRENFEETGILLNRAQLATAGVFKGKDVTTYFYCYKATEREYSDIYSTIDRAFKTFALGNFEDGSYPPEFAEHTGVTSMKAWHVYALGKERQISYGLTDDGSPMHFQRMLVLPADIIVYTLLKE